jgi:hypothetical protein
MVFHENRRWWDFHGMIVTEFNPGGVKGLTASSIPSLEKRQ